MPNRHDRAPDRRPAPRDEGTLLVETMVALTVFTTTMTALAVFFVTSFRSVGEQRGRQAAIQLATTAVEQVRALKGSSLLTGRSQQQSQDQWPDTSEAGLRLHPQYRPVQPYLDSMQIAWDPDTTDPTLGDEAAISTAPQSTKVDAITYARDIFVGICDIYVKVTTQQDTASAADDDCVIPKATVPGDTSVLRFFRVVVLVSWSDRNCPDGSCSYITSTLVARAPEPIFDFHRPSPVIKTTAVTLDRGVATSFQLQATGGQLPNTWTITALPPGLAISPSGVVSGTPTTLGSVNSTATVKDKLDRTDSGSVLWTIVAPPALTPPPATTSSPGDTITLTPTANYGVQPYTFTAAGLPAGLTQNSTSGVISGTVTGSGVFPVALTVTDANGAKATATYTHTVQSSLTLTPPADQTGTLGSAFSATAVAHGGSGSYTYTASGLPTGLVVDPASGVVSGLPVMSGRFLPTITVSDGSATATGSFELIVNTTTALIFTSPDFDKADRTSAVGQAVSLNLNLNDSPLKLSPILSATGLPPGLTMDPVSAKISGTPTTTGTNVVRVLAVNALPPQTSVFTFRWTIQ